MKSNLLLPLNSINVLDDAFGRTNRTVRQALVKRIASNYDPKCVGVLTLLRRKSDDKVFLIDGHHRYEGLTLYVAENKLNPATFTVRVDLYEESEIPASMTAARFIDSIRKGLHDRAGETFANEVQRRWDNSTWGSAFKVVGMGDPKFSGSTLTVRGILQARYMADAIKERVRENNGSLSNVKAFPAMPNGEDLIAELATCDLTTALRTVSILKEWEDAVGSQSNTIRGNFRTVQALTFALLLAEDKQNGMAGTWEDAFKRIGKMMPKSPANDTGFFGIFREYLRYANYKVAKHMNYLFGVTKY